MTDEEAVMFLGNCTTPFDYFGDAVGFFLLGAFVMLMVIAFVGGRPGRH